MYKIAVELHIQPPIIKGRTDDVNTLVDDELSLGSSPSLSLSPAKDARGRIKTKLRKRPSHHPAFNDVVSGASIRARR